MQQSNKRKKLLIDTSVLLYDKNCLLNFIGNDVYIPVIVLEELDKFKDKQGIIGENARYINRFLDEARSKGSLSGGIYFEEQDIFLYVWSEFDENTKFLKLNNSNDNMILSSIKKLKDRYPDYVVRLITKDINLRVKCDALNIEAFDYYEDYKFIKEESLYKGFIEAYEEGDLINQIYSKKNVLYKKEELNENQFVVLKNELGQSALCIYKKGYLHLLPSKDEIYKNCGIEPKNKEQIFALYSLMYEEIPLITMTGVPGSGKTFIALMCALKFIEKKTHKRIIFTRPIQTVGKDIGFLPGDINEKMAPWLAPIVDNFRNQFGDLNYFDILMEKGTIDIAPLSYIRGRSFNDAIIIVDESQNATIHELKTVITRTGKNSKIILIGDTDQIDLQYVDKFSNGLTIVTEKMKKEELTAHINFEKGYRSELANIAAKLL